MLETESQHHLVGLGLPGRQHFRLDAQQGELVFPEENSAAVWAGVTRDITTRRVGLRAETENIHILTWLGLAGIILTADLPEYPVLARAADMKG